MRLQATPILALTVAGLLAPQTAHAQSGRFELTVPSIMRGTENTGRAPTQVRWSPDGQWIYFRWLPPGTGWREALRPYRVRAATGAIPEALTAARADSIEPSIADGPLSPDGKRRVVSVQGDLFLIELPGGAIRQLTMTPGVREFSPSFDRDGRRVFFRRDDNLFALDIARGGVEQVTSIRPGPAPEEPKPAQGQRAFLEKEDLSLLGALRDRKWRDSVDKAERDAREVGQPKPCYLGKNERVSELVPSPTGAAVLVVLSTGASDNRVAQVPNYVTLSGYTEELPARTKVGDAQPKLRVAMLTVATGTMQWIQPLPSDTTGPYAADPAD